MAHEPPAGGLSTWGGRFAEPTDAFVARLNASVGFDQRLFREDIEEIGRASCRERV